MKHIIILSILVAGFSTVSLAQTTAVQPASGQKMERTPEQRAKHQTAHMVKKLNLTSDQAKALYTANLTADQKMQPLIEELKAKRQAAKAINADREAAFKNILTPDQYASYLTFKEQAKEKHKMMRRQMMQNIHQQGSNSNPSQPSENGQMQMNNNQ